MSNLSCEMIGNIKHYTNIDPLNPKHMYAYGYDTGLRAVQNNRKLDSSISMGVYNSFGMESYNNFMRGYSDGSFDYISSDIDRFIASNNRVM